jgi:hypothetical protein
MTSIRQCEANRRNAELSTGPKTEAGKSRSRRNAIRHGLTAETVIAALVDADDYAAFELAVTSGYDARTAVDLDWPVCCGVCAERPQSKAVSSQSRLYICFNFDSDHGLTIAR